MRSTIYKKSELPLIKALSTLKCSFLRSLVKLRFKESLHLPPTIASSGLLSNLSARFSKPSQRLTITTKNWDNWVSTVIWKSITMLLHFLTVMAFAIRERACCCSEGMTQDWINWLTMNFLKSQKECRSTSLRPTCEISTLFIYSI